MTTMAETTGVTAPPTPYLDDVHGQPVELRRLAEELSQPGVFAAVTARWLELGQPRLVITGMGASLYAAEVAVTRLRSFACPVQAIATAQLLEQRPPLDDAMVIAISQSGESVEIRELLTMVAPDRLTAVTNVSTSTLARAAMGPVVLNVPSDRSVAIKTYTGTVVALVLMLQALAREPLATADIRAAEDLIGASMTRWAVAAATAASLVRDARAVAVLGWGAMAPTAREAALILKEGARTPAEGMHADDFRHGSVEVVDERFAAIIFANTDVARSDPWAAVAELARLTRRVIVVGGRPHAERAGGVMHIATTPRPGIASLLTDIVPVQLLAAQLASLSGFEAGEFRNTTPVITERPSGQLVSQVRP